MCEHRVQQRSIVQVCFNQCDRNQGLTADRDVIKTHRFMGRNLSKILRVVCQYDLLRIVSVQPLPYKEEP